MCNNNEENLIIVIAEDWTRHVGDGYIILSTCLLKMANK